jgi:hypothetical protein
MSEWTVRSRETKQLYSKITALSYDGLELNCNGLWRIYDLDRTVEPQNRDSQQLLLLIRSG